VCGEWGGVFDGMVAIDIWAVCFMCGGIWSRNRCPSCFVLWAKAHKAQTDILWGFTGRMVPKFWGWGYI